jgi:hypothetical protein
MSRITQQDMIRMAREAGAYSIFEKDNDCAFELPALKRFAQLVEQHILRGYPDDKGNTDIYVMGEYAGRGKCSTITFPKDLFSKERINGMKGEA